MWGIFYALLWRLSSWIGALIGRGLGWYLVMAKLAIGCARRREWRPSGVIVGAHVGGFALLWLGAGLAWAIGLSIAAGLVLDVFLGKRILRWLGYQPLEQSMLTRTYTSTAMLEADAQALALQGWQLEQIAGVPGHLNPGRAVLDGDIQGVIQAAYGLRTPDRFTVVYSREPTDIAAAIGDLDASLLQARNTKLEPAVRLGNVAVLLITAPDQRLGDLSGVLVELGERVRDPAEKALLQGLTMRVEAELGNYPTARWASEAARTELGTVVGLSPEAREAFSARGFAGLDEHSTHAYWSGMARLLAERPWVGFALSDWGPQVTGLRDFLAELSEPDRREAALSAWRSYPKDESLMLFCGGVLLDTSHNREDAVEATQALGTLPLDVERGLAFYAAITTLLGIAWRESGDHGQAVAALRRAATLPEAASDDFAQASADELQGLALQTWVGVARSLLASPKGQWRKLVLDQMTLAGAAPVRTPSTATEPIATPANPIVRSLLASTATQASSPDNAVATEAAPASAAVRTRAPDVVCAGCGSANPGENRFCEECGSPLGRYP